MFTSHAGEDVQSEQGQASDGTLACLGSTQLIARRPVLAAQRCGKDLLHNFSPQLSSSPAPRNIGIRPKHSTSSLIITRRRHSKLQAAEARSVNRPCLRRDHQPTSNCKQRLWVEPGSLPTPFLRVLKLKFPTSACHASATIPRYFVHFSTISCIDHHKFIICIGYRLPLASYLGGGILPG